LEGAVEVLRQDWTVARNERWLTVQAPREEAPSVVQRLVAQGIEVYAITSYAQTLESFFLDVTQEQGSVSNDLEEVEDVG
jgi:hypothetical protein